MISLCFAREEPGLVLHFHGSGLSTPCVIYYLVRCYQLPREHDKSSDERTCIISKLKKEYASEYDTLREKEIIQRNLVGVF